MKLLIGLERRHEKSLAVSIYGKNPKVGTLNNATGRWNEFIATSLLSEIVLDINKDNDGCSAVFFLPNSQSQKEGAEEASSKFLSLFKSIEFASG
ncbi:Cfr10I/Bse634I family restriction endonuclease [Microcoleus sp. herbarium2]|uniref:Cfr10I/Bse634I family restriction endonuclease n=1 Tax=Microcoleus sp. herbarium2 TaxID=3055433 RepID=UPI002FCF3F2B